MKGSVRSLVKISLNRTKGRNLTSNEF